MASMQAIRQRLRGQWCGQWIEALRSGIAPLLAARDGAEVWLFGSWARGDWVARSDDDLLAVARGLVRFADRQLGGLVQPESS